MYKRTIIGTALALTVGLIAGPAAVASASSTEVMGSGAAAGGVAIEGSVTSGRTSSAGTRAGSGDGSFWEWGVGRDDVFSNYFREKSCHGATAVGKVSKKVTNVPGGRYAKALTPKKSSGNQAYYHNC